MGNFRSGRWPKGYSKRITAEECKRLKPWEAPHIGLPTVTTRQENGASRTWILCPNCEHRVRFLFRLPSGHEPSHGHEWACYRCHNLLNRSRQEWGTNAACEKAWQQYRRETDLTDVLDNHPLGRHYLEWCVGTKRTKRPRPSPPEPCDQDAILAIIERDWKKDWKRHHRSYQPRRKATSESCT